MAQYTIQSATFSKEKQVAGNPMHIYVVDLLDGNGQVVRAEVLQRPTSPQPQPGTTVEGEIKPASNPQYLPTFKRAQQGAGGGGGGRGGGGYGPKDIARITRSHSQDMALRFFEVSGGATIDWTTGDAEHLKTEVARHLNNIKRLTDHFDNDVAIAERSVGGQQQAAAPQQQPPPQAPPAQ